MHSPPRTRYGAAIPNPSVIPADAGIQVHLDTHEAPAGFRVKPGVSVLGVTGLQAPAASPASTLMLSESWTRRSVLRQLREVRCVEAAVAREESVGRRCGVGADQEVGDDAFPRSAGLAVAPPAQARVVGDGRIDGGM